MNGCIVLDLIRGGEVVVLSCSEGESKSRDMEILQWIW